MKLKAKKKELHSCCSCSKNKLVQIFRLPRVIKATKFDHFDRIGISVHKLSCLWKRFSNFLKKPFRRPPKFANYSGTDVPE